MEKKLLTESDQDDNVVDFASAKLRTKTAVGNPNDPCWLNTLGIGTIFTARKKNVNDFLLPMFCIQGRSERVTFLLEQSTQDHTLNVDPIRFCSQYELYEVHRDHETFLAEMALNEQNNKRIESPVEDNAGTEEDDPTIPDAS